MGQSLRARDLGRVWPGRSAMGTSEKAPKSAISVGRHKGTQQMQISRRTRCQSVPQSLGPAHLCGAPSTSRLLDHRADAGGAGAASFSRNSTTSGSLQSAAPTSKAAMRPSGAITNVAGIPSE